MANPSSLPAGVHVLERGWLSANSILFVGKDETAIVDTGYCTHSGQTEALVRAHLGLRPLDHILNTHLHSDHCGGNAALQSAYPSVHTRIPPGQEYHVRHWDPVALTYSPTGQQCPRFQVDGLLRPSSLVELGEQVWEIHAARGHDPHSIILFEPESATLISADALWENGFGVVFPELEGHSAFDEVSKTLDLIESISPKTIIPGHGAIFSDAPKSISVARERLDAFVSNPAAHASHAAKVLLKFKLLELKQLALIELLDWAQQTPYFALVHQRWFSDIEERAWILTLVKALEKKQVIHLENGYAIDS